MPRRLATLTAAVALVLASSAFAQAQELVQAGQILRLDGPLSQHHAGEPYWRAAPAGTMVSPGDGFYAAQGSGTLIQIGPALLELRSDSEFDWAGANTAAPILRLDRGTMDIALQPYRGAPYSVITPQGSVQLVRHGAYRVSMAANGAVWVDVWSGQANIAGTGLTLESGQAAILGSQGITVTSAPSLPDDIAVEAGLASPAQPVYARPAYYPPPAMVMLPAEPVHHHYEPPPQPVFEEVIRIDRHAPRHEEHREAPRAQEHHAPQQPHQAQPVAAQPAPTPVKPAAQTATPAQPPQQKQPDGRPHDHNAHDHQGDSDPRSHHSP